jgi:tripartite-type tricarboxylate transporter receptor subunit TctC
LARLREELQRAARSNELQVIFTQAGGRPLALNADETRSVLARDLQRWTPLVRASGIKAE